MDTNGHELKTTESETPTPLTDDQIMDSILCGDGEDDYTVYPAEELVPADFARDLERSLTAAQAELRQVRQDKDRLMVAWREEQKLRMEAEAALRHCTTAI